MRRVPVPDPPAALLSAAAAAEREQALASAHFSGGNWQAREAQRRTRFRFQVYRTPGIKQALEAAFHTLCAFCETAYAAASTGDIEHYRPKGPVTTPNGPKPGYYWLAASWHNLLPSCPRCNRTEWHTYDAGVRVRSGKGSVFPLEDESKRATRPGEEHDERPLLLHPYWDDPDKHITFERDGCARPRDGDARGEETIRTLGLNRPDLLDQRRTRLAHLQTVLVRWRDMKALVDAEPHRDEFHRWLREIEEELEEMLRPGQPYATAVAHYLGLARS